MNTTLILQAVLALFLVPAIGALLNGVDRILTARAQGRRGPPLLQPVYDVAKLLGKEPIVVNHQQIVYVYLHLGFTLLATIMVLLGQDMLMAVFILAFGGISLVLGAMSVRSPYSRIGGMREILQMLAYEPILVMLVIAIYLIKGDFMATNLVTKTGQPLLMQLPLLFLAFWAVAAIKLRKSPFDISTSHHAHQEIVKGVTVEYSGPYLALIEIGHWVESTLVCAIFAAFWATNYWVAVILALVAYEGLILLDCASARLTWPWMLRKMWTVGLGLGIANLVWLYVK